MEKISFKDIFENALKKGISTIKDENIFNEIIEELNDIEYNIENSKLTIENIENISINKESKQLKINGNFLQELGEYQSLKKNKNNIIIEFNDYIIRYLKKPISKLIIINKGVKNEI